MAQALAAGQAADRRYCDQCDQHVVNLSALSKRQAEHKLTEAGRDQRRLCVRVVRDAETGRVLTRDDLPTLTERLAQYRPRPVAAVLALALLQWACGTEEEPGQEASTEAVEVVGESGAPLTTEEMRMLMELGGYVGDSRLASQSTSGGRKRPYRKPKSRPILVTYLRSRMTSRRLCQR